MKSRLLSTTVALALLVFPLAYAQTNQPAERFTANAVSLSPEYGTGQQVVEITINRWSPAPKRTHPRWTRVSCCLNPGLLANSLYARFKVPVATTCWRSVGFYCPSVN